MKHHEIWYIASAPYEEQAFKSAILDYELICIIMILAKNYIPSGGPIGTEFKRHYL